MEFAGVVGGEKVGRRARRLMKAAAAAAAASAFNTDAHETGAEVSHPVRDFSCRTAKINHGWISSYSDCGLRLDSLIFSLLFFFFFRQLI